MANISYGVNIIPKTNNAYTLGNSDYKWSNIYAIQLNGVNVANFATNSVATSSTAGLMSAADKAKLDTLSTFNATDYTVNIMTTDWVNNSYTWTNSAVTSTAHIIVNFTPSVKDYVKGTLEYDKVTSGVQFDVENTPTGTITLIVTVMDGTSGPASGADIDDTSTALNKTWSSQKINEQVIIGNTQPLSDNNKIWINNSAETEVSVPTYSEFSELANSAVTDVKLNGTSIVSSGSANIPVAGANGQLGVCSIDSYYGIQANSSGRIYISAATTDNVKGGTYGFNPIVPSHQHEATFYGLAKAAGDSTQSASSNSVGIYTEDAKIKIQKMLGLYEPPYELVNEFTLETETYFELTTTSNGTPYNFRDVLVYVFYPQGVQGATTGYGRYYFYNSSNDKLTAETSKYNQTAADCFKYVFVKNKGNMTIADFSSYSTTSSYASWRIKYLDQGVRFNFGNIIKIALNSNDVEPAGTQIKIYAQWAY